MPKLGRVLFLSLLTISGESMLGSRLQQNKERNASPEQAQPMSQQRQVISTSSLQTLAGCIVRSDGGYSLKTKKGTYPIDTGVDLSKFVAMQVKVTGALEYHTGAVAPGSGANVATATTLHIRKIGWVIGACNESSK